MKQSALARRIGFSLPEVLIGIVLLGIIGTALTGLMLSQGRFFDRQTLQRGARSVSRSALNMILSEMRMVEAGSGVVAATGTSITLRVPYAFGVHCATSASASTISLLPTDSMMYSDGALSGYAWRPRNGQYQYVTGGASVSAGTVSDCTGASITTLTGGRVISLSPALSATAPLSAPVFLFRQIQYEFKPSAAAPGRIGLWRRVGTGTDEELVAPFDATAGFRFYMLNDDVAQASVPAPLNSIRGLELHLNGASERPSRGRADVEKSPFTTAVFFKNRLD